MREKLRAVEKKIYCRTKEEWTNGKNKNFKYIKWFKKKYLKKRKK